MERFSLRAFGPEDAAWVVERHATLYAEAEGFDARFGSLVERIVDGFVRDHDPACERGIIAEAHGDRGGCIFCVRGDAPGVAKLRLFLVEPAFRGHGLGQRLLDACLGFAQAAGYRHMRLWTHESHRAACALYRANGFRLTEAREVRSFGVDLVEQTWERALGPLQ